jgi:hypothetical protein
MREVHMQIEMKKKLKTIRNFALIIVSIISVFLIVMFTRKAIIITQNPKLFDIDFENKSEIIISYATLVGIILTFLSTIFILITIIQQSEHFEKTKQINNEKEKKDLFDRLKLMDFMLESIIKHILDTGNAIKTYAESETHRPLLNNILNFYSNKNYYRILEMDYLMTFKSIQVFFASDTENKEKLFGNLFKIIDFYSESFESLKTKYEYHSKDKFQNKISIKADLDSLLEFISNVLDLYREKHENLIESSHAFKLTNSFYFDYYKSLLGDEETDLILVRNAIGDYIKGLNEINIDQELYQEYRRIASSTANILDKIRNTTNNSTFFGNNLKSLHDNYYKEGTQYLIALDDIKARINKKIKASG